MSVFHRRYLLHEPGSWSIDLDFLPDIYRQASPRGMLTDIIAALGLIASPNAKHDQRFVTASLEKYTSAIHLTNEAISDPVRAASDEVLVTVMLITFFEVGHKLSRCLSLTTDFFPVHDMCKSRPDENTIHPHVRRRQANVSPWRRTI